MMELLNAKEIQRGRGDAAVIGRCPCCQRMVGRNCLNKAGSTCRGCGARFSLAGYYQGHKQAKVK